MADPTWLAQYRTAIEGAAALVANDPDDPDLFCAYLHGLDVLRLYVVDPKAPPGTPISATQSATSAALAKQYDLPTWAALASLIEAECIGAGDPTFDPAEAALRAAWGGVPTPDPRWIDGYGLHESQAGEYIVNAPEALAWLAESMNLAFGGFAEITTRPATFASWVRLANMNTSGPIGTGFGFFTRFDSLIFGGGIEGGEGEGEIIVAKNGHGEPGEPGEGEDPIPPGFGFVSWLISGRSPLYQISASVMLSYTPFVSIRVMPAGPPR